MAVAVWSAGLKRILGLEEVCGDGLVMSATGMVGEARAVPGEAGSALRHQGECLLVVIVLPPAPQNQHPAKRICYLSRR